MAKCKFLQEFKDFAMKGNVVDMAVGVIIGGAFGKIVSSLVNDIIMPAIGSLMGGLDFTTLRWVIKPAYTTEAGKEVAEAALNYGNFIQTFVDFLIIALSIFLVIRGIAKMNEKANAKKKAAEEAAAAAAAAAAPAPEPTKEEVLLGEIRDLLKKQADK